MNPLCSKWSWTYQKYAHLLDSLVKRQGPQFVYQSNPNELTDEIPVFTFHLALPEWFEEQCKYLKDNQYRTLSGDEFLTALRSPKREMKKSVVLTFDDGLKHVWTVAYPILKKYNLKAMCFLIPACVSEGKYPIRPTLEDYWKGHAPLKDILNLRDDDTAFATWEEIKIMHESGVIDFQSHTMHHSLVFASNKVFTFMNPRYNKNHYGNFNIPIYSKEGVDVMDRVPIMGMPIYSSMPRMSATRRYFDDESIRRRCIERVEKEGAEKFFANPKWPNILRKLVQQGWENGKVTDKYEDPQERDRVVLEELRQSRLAIESHLCGKEVKHLCFPWYEAEEFAVQASKIAGFQANYFGHHWKRATNSPGPEPVAITRMEEIFLKRLPGKDRDSLFDIVHRLYAAKKVPAILAQT